MNRLPVKASSSAVRLSFRAWALGFRVSDLVLRRSLNFAGLQYSRLHFPAQTRLVLALELGERTDLHTRSGGEGARFDLVTLWGVSQLYSRQALESWN